MKSNIPFFMFMRDYMDYHRNRFVDHSLLVYDGAGSLFSLLPAIVTDSHEVISHAGLSFGGLCTRRNASYSSTYDSIQKLIEYCSKNRIAKLTLKLPPLVFQADCTESDFFILSRLGARLQRVDLTSVIFCHGKFEYSKGRRSSVRAAGKCNLLIDDSGLTPEYWEVLNSVLTARHNRTAVHSYDEIKNLGRSFPKNIRFYRVMRYEEIVAGVVLFLSPGIVHTQYMFNTELGRSLGALDFLVDHLIHKYKLDHQYFSFGVSTDESLQGVNVGLLRQKEGFGARSLAFKTVSIDLL